MVLGGHQAGEHAQAAGRDAEVVVPAAERPRPHLVHAQAAALRAVFGRQLLEVEHAVGEALQLDVARLRGAVVQQEHRAVAAGEELLEGQDLAAVAQRITRQQPHLRQRIEHHAQRVHALDHLQHALGRLAQLDLGGVEQRVVALGGLVARRELVQGDVVERPAVGGGHASELLGRLRQGDVEAALAVVQAVKEELQGSRRLAGAGIALHEVHPVARQAAAQDVVETFDTSGCQVRLRRSRGHSTPSRIQERPQEGR